MGADKIINSNKPYVYELIDPRNDEVFYVGKGMRSRIDHHEMETLKGKYSAKCFRIREIWSAGHDVKKHVICNHESHEAAFAAEEKRIEEIGLENLTNSIPGGRGKYVPPEETAEERRQNKVNARAIKKHIDMVDRLGDKVEWYFPDIKDGAAKAREAHQIMRQLLVRHQKAGLV